MKTFLTTEQMLVEIFENRSKTFNSDSEGIDFFRSLYPMDTNFKELHIICGIISFMKDYLNITETMSNLYSKVRIDSDNCTITTIRCSPEFEWVAITKEIEITDYRTNYCRVNLKSPDLEIKGLNINKVLEVNQIKYANSIMDVLAVILYSSYRTYGRYYENNI